MALLDTPVATVFISYSHAPKDEVWKDRLVEQLGVLAAEQGFTVWHDRRIVTGDDWNSEIERALDTPCVAVLLISSAVLTSPFIRGHEVPHLLRRREDGKLTLVQVVVRACAWDDLAWSKRLEMRLKITRPWEQFVDQDIDSHLTAIAKEIAKLVRAATREREPPPAPPARAPEPKPSAVRVDHAVGPASEPQAPSGPPPSCALPSCPRNRSTTAFRLSHVRIARLAERPNPGSRSTPSPPARGRGLASSPASWRLRRSLVTLGARRASVSA